MSTLASLHFTHGAGRSNATGRFSLSSHAETSLPKWELSNSLAENRGHGPALSVLNASRSSGPRKKLVARRQCQRGLKVAAMISIVESCRRLSIPVKDYLLDILPGN
jgi:hypothetical protein